MAVIHTPEGTRRVGGSVPLHDTQRQKPAVKSAMRRNPGSTKRSRSGKTTKRGRSFWSF